MQKQAELVAPAGNLEKLKVAVACGADAVYLAGRTLSLRARSDNFTRAEIEEGIAYARARGVRAYVLLNVFPHNRHLAEMRDELQYLERLQPDAFVISDIGAFELARDIAPGIPIHVSTQSNITNWLTARFWKRIGATRLILARELSLQEIAEIASRVDIELEIFIHGAMCMAYSGRCFMSRHFTGRDANLGDCAQPCRWTYHLVEETRPGEMLEAEQHPGGTSIFSSRDLCMIEHLPEVLASGVIALKIEGRMKSVYYVGVTTRSYRAALDSYYASPSRHIPDPTWLNELKQTSNRAFTTGFYLEELQKGIAPVGNAERTSSRSFVGLVTEVEDDRVKIDVRGRIAIGDMIECVQPRGEIVSHRVDSLIGQAGEKLDVAQPNSVIYLPLRLQQFTLLRK